MLNDQICFLIFLGPYFILFVQIYILLLHFILFVFEIFDVIFEFFVIDAFFLWTTPSQAAFWDASIEVVSICCWDCESTAFGIIDGI